MADQKNLRNFAIIAHIDHGKSTLADRFLELTGTVERRKMRKQYLDQMDLERERGITIKLQPVRMEYHAEFPISHPASGRPKGDNDLRQSRESPTGVASSDYIASPRRSRDLRTSTKSGQFPNKSQIQNPNYQKHILNLIDTPGHVDFSYEVSRSLAAVEGVILLIDATKGVQAQTLSNLNLAQQQDLKIIPAINKIDLPGARVAEVEEEIRNIFGNEKIPPDPSFLNEGEILPPFVKGGLGGIYKISAKEGTGVKELLDVVIEKIPPPTGDSQKPLRALVFDSKYDAYKGILAYVRVVDGEIRRGDKIILMASGASAEALEVGIFKPDLKAADELKAGEIGYIATGLKDAALCRVGDTIAKTDYRLSTAGYQLKPLPGYLEPKPMIFASFYPSTGSGQALQETQDYNVLKDALAKLKLSDASLVFEPESSEALGRGFKCGFLGMLHMEIVSERLKREYDLSLIVTTPNVAYQFKEKGSVSEKTIYSPQQLSDVSKVDEIKEPWVKLEVIAPNEYFGAAMKLLNGFGGIYIDTQYIGTQRVIISYEAPLREIVTDFYDKLKSATAGYASMSYEMIDWRLGDLVCLDILVAREKIEPFSRIVPRARAATEGRAVVQKLKEVLPPQLFTVSLQAAVGGKIMAREDIGARRKDVTGYLYGGDVSRKRKLLEKQKKGKKKMLASGKVNIPQDVFLKVLRK